MARKRLTKKQKQIRMKIILGAVTAVFFFGLGVIFGDSSYSFSGLLGQLSDSFSKWQDGMERPSATETAGLAELHVFDVGQGSAALLKSSSGTNILIDSGRHDDGNKRIVSYLDEHIGMGNAIDLMIFTHNHADHIGNGDLIFEYFEVEEVWMNGLDTTTATYENILDAILESEAEYFEPKAGDEVEVGPFYVEVLHPQPDEPIDDQNDESIITRISVNDISIMTSGDAGYQVEDRVVNQNADLYSEIMIAAHHGSSTSNGWNWLGAVNPEIAVYSAGKNNSYGHPHREVVQSFEEKGIPLYGTDVNGTVSFYIDESGQYEMVLEKE